MLISSKEHREHLYSPAHDDCIFKIRLYIEFVKNIYETLIIITSSTNPIINRNKATKKTPI